MRFSLSTLGCCARAPLFWLAVVYLLVGVVYALVTPVFEKPDEEGHYGYLLYLREHRALPPLDPNLAGWASFEFKQPPLYYAVTALLTAWLPDVAYPERLLTFNPYLASSVPGYRNDNRNVFLHPPDMTPLILAARLVSLMCGLGALVASYYLAAHIFSKSSPVPIAVAAVAGFQPGFLYMATAANNDAAVACGGAVLLAVLMRRLKQGNRHYFAVLVGVILGLSSLIKVSALVFFPLTGLALLVIHRGFRPSFFRDGITIVTVALLVGGWWYARNAIVYHDPLTLRAHTVGVAVDWRLTEQLKRNLFSVERTYWANPSRTFISPMWLDQVLIWWGRIGLGLLAVSLVLKRHSSRPAGSVLLVLASWPVTFLLLLIFYWNQKSAWPFGRLLFPAIAPAAVLLVIGWYLVFPARWQRRALTFSVCVVVVAGFATPFVSLYPLYHPSREWQAKQVEHSTGTVYMDSETGQPVARLIGYNLPQPYAVAGTYFPIELCWEPLGVTDIPYAVFVQMLDIGQLNAQDMPTVWGRRETFPGLGNRPTDRWTLHKVFCDMTLVPVFAEAPTPLGAAIEVGLTDQNHRSRLQALDAAGDLLDLAAIGGVPILSSKDLTTAKRTPLYTLDNAIGLDQILVSAGAGNSLTLTMTWQSLRSVAYDATMFVHAQDAEGNIVAQADRQPLEGRFPTSYWQPGQIITDVVRLSLEADKLDQPLTLNVGLYIWPSMLRLPVKDAYGAPQRDDVMVVRLPPGAMQVGVP